MSALAEQWEQPRYIMKIMKLYLSEREILVENNINNFVRYNVTRGVPQGSVLGPFCGTRHDIILGKNTRVIAE